jgi:stage II sporulation protein AA (anti-sigma F factor antagonist)
VVTVGTVRVVKAAGDVDLAFAGELWDVLEPLLTPGAVVALDCSGITFLDSTGLRSAVVAANRAKETDAVFCLIAPSEPVTRVLDLSGVTGMFTVYADPAEAAADGAATRP